MIFSFFKKIPACHRAARLLDYKEVGSYCRNISTFHFVVSRRCQYSRWLSGVHKETASFWFSPGRRVVKNGMSETLTSVSWARVLEAHITLFANAPHGVANR